MNVKVVGRVLNSLRLLILAATLLAANASAAAVLIDFQLRLLSGPNRFEYTYTLTNVSLGSPLSWFSVDFDTTLYEESTLAITTVGLPDWSEALLSSLPGVPAQYDAYKLTGPGLGIGDTETGFSVAFTWLGAGAPGSQQFTIYDPNTFVILATGTTTAAGEPPPNPMPEPNGAALMMAALLAAFSRCRLRSAT